jgi:hypothetical protein
VDNASGSILNIWVKIRQFFFHRTIGDLFVLSKKRKRERSTDEAMNNQSSADSLVRPGLATRYKDKLPTIKERLLKKVPLLKFQDIRR